MQVEATFLEGVLRITPDVFLDDRGSFAETYQHEKYSAHDIPPLVQFNESFSQKHVLRGLHIQNDPAFMQGKLVRVGKGAVLDVAVDVRPGSASFGAHFKTVLSRDNAEQLWIPPGYAHGFLALEDDSQVMYGCSAYYHPQSEVTLMWNDAELNIDWGISDPIVSAKDAAGCSLQEFKTMMQR